MKNFNSNITKLQSNGILLPNNFEDRLRCLNYFIARIMRTITLNSSSELDKHAQIKVWKYIFSLHNVNLFEMLQFWNFIGCDKFNLLQPNELLQMKRYQKQQQKNTQNIRVNWAIIYQILDFYRLRKLISSKWLWRRLNSCCCCYSFFIHLLIFHHYFGFVHTFVRCLCYNNNKLN